MPHWFLRRDFIFLAQYHPFFDFVKRKLPGRMIRWIPDTTNDLPLEREPSARSVKPRGHSPGDDGILPFFARAVFMGCRL